MLNFPLHTERTDIIAGAFNSQYTAKLVIHFYGHITHVVLDPRSEDALIIVCANLFGTVISDSLSTGKWRCCQASQYISQCG